MADGRANPGHVFTHQGQSESNEDDQVLLGVVVIDVINNDNGPVLANVLVVSHDCDINNDNNVDTVVDVFDLIVGNTDDCGVVFD